MKKFLEINEEHTLINIDSIKSCYLIHTNGYGNTVDEICVTFIDGSQKIFENGQKIFNHLKRNKNEIH